MGNTATKERSQTGSAPGNSSSSRSGSLSGPSSGSHSQLGQSLERLSTPSIRSRHHSSRPTLESTLFGLASSSRGHEREEHRTKEERRAEREREREKERVKERERSMAEESVDGRNPIFHSEYIARASQLSLTCLSSVAH